MSGTGSEFIAWTCELWNYFAFRANMYWPEFIGTILIGIMYGTTKRVAVHTAARRIGLNQIK